MKFSKFFEHYKNLSDKSIFNPIRSRRKHEDQDKQALRIARKSDYEGNYDVDGVSYDGNDIHVGGESMQKRNG